MSFANGDLTCWVFDMDYSGYVLAHFPGFQAETPRLAAKFARTVDRAYESCAWVDDEAFSDALSVALYEFFSSPMLPEFY